MFKLNMNIKDFECFCCHEILVKPVTLSCSHSLCSFCLKDDMKCCPYCKNKINNNKEVKINNLLDKLLQFAFPEEYKEKLIFFEKYEKILEKRKEYLNSLYRQTINKRLKTYLNDKFLCSVYECTKDLNTIYSEDYTYEQILNEFISISKCRGFITYGPYIRSRYAINIDTNFKDHEIMIIGFISLMIHNVNIKDKMYSYMKSIDEERGYINNDTSLYYQTLESNILDKYIKNKLDFTFDPPIKEENNCFCSSSITSPDNSSSSISSL